MKIAFLCNPASHKIKKFPLLVSMIQKHVPAQREIFLVDRALPNSLETHVERILDGGFERIAVAGGDGTLNRAVNALEIRRALGRITLGIIPFGTCNDFARSLGFSALRLTKALKALANNHVRPINIARINNHFFVNNAGFGKRYPAEGRRGNLQVIREMVPVSLKSRWSEGSIEGKFFMMLCANAPYFSGGLRFSRKSDPSDNVLDFFFVKKMLKLNLALRLFFGKARFPLRLSRFSRGILKVSAQKLKLETEEPVSILIDGESKENLAHVREATFEIAGNCRFLTLR